MVLAGDRPFQCSQCEKKFLHKIILDQHVRQGCKIRISHMPHYAPRALWATKISAQDAREGAHIMTQGRIQNFVLERARYIKIGKLNYLCQLITTK